MAMLRQSADREYPGTDVFGVLGGTVTLDVGSGTEPVVEPKAHRPFVIQPKRKVL